MKTIIENELIDARNKLKMANDNPKRVQYGKHNETVARLEGEVIALRRVLLIWVDETSIDINKNVIEQ